MLIMQISCYLICYLVNLFWKMMFFMLIIQIMYSSSSINISIKVNNFIIPNMLLMRHFSSFYYCNTTISQWFLNQNEKYCRNLIFTLPTQNGYKKK